MAAKLAGSGRGKYDLGQNSDINVTPFVDILLVLLIIFMVAIPTATVAIKVDLPPAQPPKEKPKKDPVYVSLGEGGKVYVVDGGVDIPTSLDGLAAELKSKGLTPTDSILIRADANVFYEDFMTTLNQLQTDGFFKVGLISEDMSMT